MTNSNEHTMATTAGTLGSTVTTTTITPSSPAPKQVKGGVFAAADIILIKNALAYYARLDISDAEQRQVANLLHRLNSRI